MLPSHLTEDIYQPFRGSDRTKRVRKDLVDLIIPNAAGPGVFGRLFESLMAHLSYQITGGDGRKMGGVRLIPVSQGEHGSHQLLMELQRRYPDTVFPVFKSKNLPPPVPYNDGLQKSAMLDPLSEFIMFLDDDMVMLRPGMIELEREHLLKHGFANVATEHCFFGDKEKLGPHGEAKDFGMGSFFFRRKLFEKVGYLDEYFHFHCSDTDFNRRVRLAGGKISVVPDSEKFMFHEHQQGTHNFFRGTHQPVINHDWELFAKKWYHEGHDTKDIDLGCAKCQTIAATQLPLGRRTYLTQEQLEARG